MTPDEPRDDRPATAGRPDHEWSSPRRGDDWSAVFPAPRRAARSIPRTLVIVLSTLALLGAVAVAVTQLPALAGTTPTAPAAPVAPAAAPSARIVPQPAPGPGAAPSSAPRSKAIPTLRATIPTAPTPGYVEITPDGRQAWIAHRDEGIISVLDLTLGAVVATIPSPAGPPRFIAFCPPGTPGAGRAYVSIYGVTPDGAPDDTAPHLVSVIDQATLAETGQIPVGRRPFASSCSPDGTTLVVPSHDDGRLDIIDTASATLRTSVPVARNPHWAAYDRLGHVWTANHESNAVTRVDAATLTVLDVQTGIGTSPHAVAVNPDSTRVAVVAFDSDQLYLFDAATAALVRPPVALGGGPQDVAWTTDGARVLTTDVDDDRITVVDAATGQITATLPAPPGQPGTWDGPTSIAVTPDGTTAVVTLLNSGAVALLDLVMP